MSYIVKPESALEYREKIYKRNLKNYRDALLNIYFIMRDYEASKEIVNNIAVYVEAKIRTRRICLK